MTQTIEQYDVKKQQKQFLHAAAMFLLCRQAGMNKEHRDKFGALLGEMDWIAEMRLIIKEWRCNVESSRIYNAVQ